MGRGKLMIVAVGALLAGMLAVIAVQRGMDSAQLKSDFEAALSLPDDAEYTVTVGRVLGQDRVTVTGGLARGILDELSELECEGRAQPGPWQPQDGDYDLFITSEATGLTTITLYSGGSGELSCADGNIVIGGTEGLYQLVDNALSTGGEYPEGSATLWPRFTQADLSQAIVTAPKVYSQPSLDSEFLPYCSLESQYCLVLAQCISGSVDEWSVGDMDELWNDEWVLIAFFSPEMPANLGWVPLAYCTEYTEETKTQMLGQFSARPGAEIYAADGSETGRVVTENDIYYIVDAAPDEHGLIEVYMAGSGSNVKLNASDLIYPEVGLDYFDGVLPPSVSE